MAGISSDPTVLTPSGAERDQRRGGHPSPGEVEQTDPADPAGQRAARRYPGRQHLDRRGTWPRVRSRRSGRGGSRCAPIGPGG